MIKSKISGVGYYVPENIVKNSDIEEMMDTSDQWIRERTGIEERRWVNDDKLSTSLMGTYASQAAIKDARSDKNLKDFIKKWNKFVRQFGSQIVFFASAP